METGVVGVLRNCHVLVAECVGMSCGSGFAQSRRLRNLVSRSVVVALVLKRSRELFGAVRRPCSWRHLDGIHGRGRLPARRTAPPIDHFGFVDLETMCIARCEAGCRTDRAVDVGHRATTSADQMVVVVTHPIFVPGWRTWRLDATDKILVDQDGQRVVDRLARDRPDRRPNVLGHFVGRGVRTGRDSAQRRQPLSGHLHPVLSQ